MGHIALYDLYNVQGMYTIDLFAKYRSAQA